MSRYIDADALHEALKAKQKWVVRCGDKHNEGYTYDQVHFAIDDAPSIDIEPKRGEWKPFDLTWGRSIWYCTACEEGVDVPCDIWTHKPVYNYCPNCGADMREREGE